MITNRKSVFAVAGLAFVLAQAVALRALADETAVPAPEKKQSIHLTNNYLVVGREGGKVTMNTHIHSLPQGQGMYPGNGLGMIGGGGMGTGMPQPAGGMVVNPNRDITLNESQRTFIRAGRDSLSVEGNGLTEYHVEAQAAKGSQSFGGMAGGGFGAMVGGGFGQEMPTHHLSLKASGSQGMVSDPLHGCSALAGGGAAGELRFDRIKFGAERVDNLSGSAEVGLKAGGICQMDQLVVRLTGEGLLQNQYVRNLPSLPLVAEARASIEVDLAQKLGLKGQVSANGAGVNRQLASARYKDQIAVGGIRIPVYVGIEAERSETVNRPAKEMMESIGIQADPAITQTRLSGVAGIGN